MTGLPEVSVIMPTRALARRVRLVHRALESLLSQEGVRVVPIVVINGPHRDPSLTRQLKRDSRLRILELDDSGIPGALKAGRQAMQTDWFCTLDDDDVCLPGALAARVEALRAKPALDTVVTNGIRCDQNGDELIIPDMSFVERDPLEALTHSNWLLPGAWLCRSEGVGGWLFDGMPSALECTYLALQFSLRCKLGFLDRPTVAWYMDTPESESKLPDYDLRQLAALGSLLELPLPPKTRRWVRESITQARHSIADRRLQNGQLTKAWRWHLSSLPRPGGWRYLPFGLRLLLAALKE